MSSEHDTAPGLEPVEDLGGRPSLYRDDFPDQVWGLSRLGLPCTEGQLARFFGVHGSTIRRWKSQKPEFCAAIEGGRLHFDCQVVEALFLNAIGYSYTEEQAFKLKRVIYGDNGKKLREVERIEIVKAVKKLPPDVRAQIFWLKHRQPKLWGDSGESADSSKAPPSLADDATRQAWLAAMAERYLPKLEQPED